MGVLRPKKTKAKGIEEKSPSMQIWPLIFIVALTFFAFRKVIGHSFTDWDDNLYVVDLEMIRALNWANVKAMFTQLVASLYTPLTIFSFALEYKLFGMSPDSLNPAVFHSTNLIIHLCNVILAYFLLSKWTKNQLIIFFSVALFAIHPLNTEAVSWISSRKDLLFTFFYLLGILCWYKYRAHGKIFWNIATISVYYAALLSKPTALSFPIILMLIDYFEDRLLSWKLLSNKIPLFAGSIAAGLLGIYIIREVDVMASAPEGYNLIEIISLAAYALAFYIYSTLVPFSLNNFHSYPHQIDGTIGIIYYLSPIFLLTLTYVLYRLWPRYDKLIFGFAFFLIIIGPTWRLVPTGYPIVADRYFYLASIGILFFMVEGMALIGEKIKLTRQIALSFTLAPLCLVFFFKTQSRVEDWKNSITLWESALDEDPTLHNAYSHLAIAYDEFGNDERALMFYEKALNENPNLPEILNSAAVIYFESNEHKKALEYFNRAIKLDTTSELPYYNRGNLLKANQRWQLSINDYNQALTLRPQFAEAYNNRGISKIMIADTAGALKDFEMAVKFKPTDKMFVQNLNRLKEEIAP